MQCTPSGKEGTWGCVPLHFAVPIDDIFEISRTHGDRIWRDRVKIEVIMIGQLLLEAAHLQTENLVCEQ